MRKRPAARRRPGPRPAQQHRARVRSGGGRPEPGEGDRLGTAPDGRPIHRYDAEPPHARTTGDIEAMCLYAGQSVGLVHEVEPAAEIVAELVADAEAALGLRSAR